jgi:hypothetical protein
MTSRVEDQHHDYHPGCPHPLEKMCLVSINVSHLPDLNH